MNVPFDMVWDYIEDIPGSFTKLNAEKLYEYALQIPVGGVIVEVGVDQCRSGSVILFAARERLATVVLVDLWPSVLMGNEAKVRERLNRDFSDVCSMVVHGASVTVATAFAARIEMIHIDANHFAPNPGADCMMWLPKLLPGGIACFHDCQTESFPAVDEAVAEHTAGWEDLGTWESLGIRRKP